ncbi:MAG: tripartite tricarboxylate transporter substrate binding protein [Comamonadaceae bacterium]|nr:tripartite tricarboxylate transporter substrate binding protein [Comamonadaceae bacterium]
MKPLRLLAAVLIMAPVAAAAQAQTKFPDKTIRMVVPFAAGGGVDSAARLLAIQLQTQLGVAVIVDNRSGANGILGGKSVETAAADGYTLLFSAATHVLAQQVMAKAPYDPQVDFTPIAKVAEAPLMLVLSPQSTQTKLSEVLAHSKKEGDRWTAAIPAAGAPAHLATLMLAKAADAKFTYVTYKGTQPAVVDVAGGHVQMLLDSMVALQPLAKAGRVKPIFVTSAKRVPLAPDVPTAAESGYPGLTYASWYGVWAPKGLPPERVKQLNAAITLAVAEQTKHGAWAQLGLEPVPANDPEQFKQFIAGYVRQSADLLKSAGFKPE